MTLIRSLIVTHLALAVLAVTACSREDDTVPSGIHGPIRSDYTAVSAIRLCDELASDPHDLDSRGAGVSDQRLRRHARQAVEACGWAVDLAESTHALGRLHYQYGRALLVAGSAEKAAAQFEYASNRSHLGGTTRLIEYYLSIADVDNYTLHEYASILSEVASSGYAPAAELYDAIAADIAVASGEQTDFDSTLFYNGTVMDAAYRGDFEFLDSWSTKDMIVDKLGFQGSLLLYVSGFEDTLSQVWFCPKLSSPGLAAAAKAAETEGLIDLIIDEPKKVLENSGETIAAISGIREKNNRSFSGIFKSVTKSFARNERQEETLRRQGSKDAVVLSSHFGCDSDTSLRIAQNLGAYFNALNSSQ